MKRGRGAELKQSPRTAREVPARYRHLSTAERYETAGRLVVFDGWSQVAAAREVGCSRERFNKWLNEDDRREFRRLESRKAELGAATADLRASAGVGSVRWESRRVGSIHEFVERYFSWMVCPDCGRHHETPRHVSEIFDALQSKDPRVLINMPPYHSKTTTSVLDTVYDVCRDPNSQTIFISKALPLARAMVGQAVTFLTNRDLYGEGPNLVDDWGPFDGAGSKWAATEVFVSGRMSAAKDPTLFAVGVGGQIYGRRAWKIKADDCATLDNQATPAAVEKMVTWFDQEVTNRVGVNGQLAWLGTRVAPGDVYSVLERRPGYRVLKYPCILDESGEETLWGDHFSYGAAVARRTEMKPSTWQLVYQQVSMLGADAPFDPEALEAAKNPDMVAGQYMSGWRLVAGLDLAGGNKGSGFTAGVLLGVDLQSTQRRVIDLFNEKSMRAPALKDKIFEWSAKYPINVWKVENNGVQSNLVQYNDEIIRPLAQRGIRVEGHNTQSNKWDPEFGVEAIAPLFVAGMIDIPWGNQGSSLKFQQLIDQLLAFPMGTQSDLVMALWFAELGVKDLLRRISLPMFDGRRRVPADVAARRMVVDFGASVVRPVTLHEQARKEWSEHTPYRRTMLSQLRSRNPRPSTLPEDEQFVNVTRAGDG